jgi:hypothetical protein
VSLTKPQLSSRRPDIDPCPSSRDAFLDRCAARDPEGNGHRAKQRCRSEGSTRPEDDPPSLIASNKGCALWTADASPNATTTSVYAGQRLCGAPRRNRTGDPILTMYPRPTAMRPCVFLGRSGPKVVKLWGGHPVWDSGGSPCNRILVGRGRILISCYRPTTKLSFPQLAADCERGRICAVRHPRPEAELCRSARVLSLKVVQGLWLRSVGAGPAKRGRRGSHPGA